MVFCPYPNMYLPEGILYEERCPQITVDFLLLYRFINISYGNKVNCVFATCKEQTFSNRFQFAWSIFTLFEQKFYLNKVPFLKTTLIKFARNGAGCLLLSLPSFPYFCIFPFYNNQGTVAFFKSVIFSKPRNNMTVSEWHNEE